MNWSERTATAAAIVSAMSMWKKRINHVAWPARRSRKNLFVRRM